MNSGLGGLFQRKRIDGALRPTTQVKNNRFGETARVTGFTINPRVSKVSAPSSGVTFAGPKTTFEARRRSSSSKKASPDVVRAASPVGQGELPAIEFRDCKLASYRTRKHAENCASVDQKF
jgi:hypothetical protein